ncbi:leucyl aminopeptidase, partial [Mycena galericulata]
MWSVFGACSRLGLQRSRTAYDVPYAFFARTSRPRYISSFRPTYHRKSHSCAMEPVQDKYRLPLNVKPTHYDLTVWTNLETLTFGGFVNISLDIHEETSAFELNSKGLVLGNASIYSDVTQTEQSQSGHSFDKDMQRVTFTFPNALPAGVAFDAPLGSSMTGYYKAAWEEDGKTKHYALTQFEPTDARAAFPCWDEPLLKATFAITMVSHADTVNLSNMPAISEEVYEPGSNVAPELGKLLQSLSNERKWKITRFATTPLMSSYIVAFACGPFVHLEQNVVMPLSGKTVPLRIYSTPDVIHQTAFALDVAARVIPIYETVFDVEYPLPKLDTLVASDFDAGAMENWGLITGTGLLFGNITTMRWWDNLYLNEGFATLMGEVIIISEQIFPEWRPNSEFIPDHLQSALALDAKLSSHPIEVECPDANHINQIFDALSYSKAASVLRMLCDYVGEDKFLKGVSLYLKNNLYGNTVTNDLFEGISAATGVDTVKLMDNWIKKIGFPVITVTENANGIHVRQDRFIESGPVDPKDNETIWNVPLSILASDHAGQVSIDRTAILEEREKDVTLDTSQTFKLNAGTVGVYRVLYPPERLAKIAAEASKENSIFTLDDRMGILNDVTALSKAGLAKLSDTLTVIDIWSKEKECDVSDTLGISRSRIVDTLRAFIRSLFVPIVKRLGYEYSADESPDITQLRTLAISSALTGKDQGVIDELKGRFAHYLETGDDSRIPADLQTAIFVAAVRYGGRAEYEAVVKIQEQPKTPTARIIAMGVTQDQTLLDETFAYILTKSRDQDTMYYFRGLQSNIIAKRQLVRFEGNFTLNHLVTISFAALSTREDYEDVEAFFKDKDNSKYSMALAQTLESIRTRITYIERSSDDLTEWLNKWEKT